MISDKVFDVGIGTFGNEQLGRDNGRHAFYATPHGTTDRGSSLMNSLSASARLYDDVAFSKLQNGHENDLFDQNTNGSEKIP